MFSLSTWMGQCFVWVKYIWKQGSAWKHIKLHQWFMCVGDNDLGHDSHWSTLVLVNKTDQTMRVCEAAFPSLILIPTFFQTIKLLNKVAHAICIENALVALCYDCPQSLACASCGSKCYLAHCFIDEPMAAWTSNHFNNCMSARASNFACMLVHNNIASRICLGQFKAKIKCPFMERKRLPVSYTYIYINIYIYILKCIQMALTYAATTSHNPLYSMHGQRVEICVEDRSFDVLNYFPFFTFQ